MAVHVLFGLIYLVALHDNGIKIYITRIIPCLMVEHSQLTFKGVSVSYDRFNFNNHNSESSF